MMAVRANDDNLAKEALTRSRITSSCRAVPPAMAEQKHAVDQLKLALRALNAKIEEAKRKKNLWSRARSARKPEGDPGDDGAVCERQRVRGVRPHVDQDRADGGRGEGRRGARRGYTGDVLAHKFQELETHGGAEEDLTALKRKMSSCRRNQRPASAGSGPASAQAARRSKRSTKSWRAPCRAGSARQQELRMKR